MLHGHAGSIQQAGTRHTCSHGILCSPGIVSNDLQDFLPGQGVWRHIGLHLAAGCQALALRAPG